MPERPDFEELPEGIVFVCAHHEEVLVHDDKAPQFTIFKTMNDGKTAWSWDWDLSWAFCPGLQTWWDDNQGLLNIDPAKFQHEYDKQIELCQNSWSTGINLKLDYIESLTTEQGGMRLKAWL
jgi:hypothetical protein